MHPCSNFSPVGRGHFQSGWAVWCLLNICFGQPSTAEWLQHHYMRLDKQQTSTTPANTVLEPIMDEWTVFGQQAFIFGPAIALHWQTATTATQNRKHTIGSCSQASVCRSSRSELFVCPMPKSKLQWRAFDEDSPPPVAEAETSPGVSLDAALAGFGVSRKACRQLRAELRLEEDAKRHLSY